MKISQLYPSFFLFKIVDHCYNLMTLPQMRWSKPCLQPRNPHTLATSHFCSKWMSGCAVCRSALSPLRCLSRPLWNLTAMLPPHIPACNHDQTNASRNLGSDSPCSFGWVYYTRLPTWPRGARGAVQLAQVMRVTHLLTCLVFSGPAWSSFPDAAFPSYQSLLQVFWLDRFNRTLFIKWSFRFTVFSASLPCSLSLPEPQNMWSHFSKGVLFHAVDINVQFYYSL